MADQVSKAEEFEKKAEKKLSGWALFGSKYEDAADLFEKAANSFKLAKSCFFSFSLFFFSNFILFQSYTMIKLDIDANFIIVVSISTIGEC